MPRGRPHCALDIYAPSSPCEQKNPAWRRCKCPKGIQGTLDTGEFIRRSAGLRGHAARRYSFKFLRGLPGLAHGTMTRLDKPEHLLLAHATYRSPEPLASVRSVATRSFERARGRIGELLVWALRSGGCPVLIRVTTWPMICLNCRRPYREEISWYHETRSMTRRPERYLREPLVTLTTFQQIALDTCQERKTINGILFSAIRELKGYGKKDFPRVSGIAEVYFNKRPCTIAQSVGADGVK